MRPENQRRKFWNKVDRSGDCWLWTGMKGHFGYGAVRRDGRTRGAHRVAFEYAVGPVPNDSCVLHRCDNPPCVNPAHLFLGSKADNAADKMAKGRYRGLVGDECPWRKISASDVAAIRVAAERGEKQRSIAQRFGIAQATVSDVVNGRRWKVAA